MKTLREQIIEILKFHQDPAEDLNHNTRGNAVFSHLYEDIAEEILSKLQAPAMSAEETLIDVYGCKDINDLKRCFLDNDESLEMILQAMEQFALTQQPQEPESVEDVMQKLDLIVGRNSEITDQTHEDLCAELLDLYLGIPTKQEDKQEKGGKE